ncbi:flagellar biosynthetic protein FliO [Phycisphaeraceae bacterium D3-23]
MSNPFCVSWFRVVLAGAVVVCGAWSGTAAAQDDVADRIAAQRDRAAEQARPPADSVDTSARTNDAGGEASPASGVESDVDPGVTPAADNAELSDIPPTVHPEELLPLGPTGAAEGDGAGGQQDAMGSGWVMNTLGALGVVIALIFLVRWVAKRWGVGGGVRVSASPIVEVLSRTTVAPRNHVVLLRVGSRILVVNDGTSGMRTLATIEDPDEVAGLLQSVQAAGESSMSNSFGKVMSKLSGQWSSAEDAAELGGDDTEVVVDRARGALTGLRDRLNLSADSRGGGGA